MTRQTLVVALCLATAGWVRAQPTGAILGTVIARDIHQPVGFARVALDDSAVTVLAARDGRFHFGAIPRGTHTLLVRQVGFLPERVTIAVDSAVVTVDVSLMRIPIGLDTVRVGRPVACKAGGFANSTSAPAVRQLLDEVSANVEQLKALAQHYSMTVTYERSRWQETTRRDTVGLVVDRVTEGSSDGVGQKVGYVPGAVLTLKTDSAGHASYSLKLPSFAELGSPAFQNHHCFRYAGTDSVAGVPTYRVDFVPSSDFSGPDVEGTIYLDRQSFMLKRATFELVNPPRGFSFSDVQTVATYREIAPYFAVPDRLDATQNIQQARLPSGQRIVRGYQVNILTKCEVRPRDSTVAPAVACGGR